MKKAQPYLLVFCALLLFQAPAAVLYVNVNSAGPSAPYAGWATAANSIQDAVDAASPGDVVLVTNGIYRVGGRLVHGAITNRVAIDKPVTVQSVNGAAFTAIEGFTTNDASAMRCVYLTNSAVLAGFTLTNGSTIDSGIDNYDWFNDETGAGAWCESSSSVISNCVFINNVAIRSGGGVFGGTAMNCAFTNNFSGGVGGGADASGLVGCVLVNNRSIYGGGAYNSSLTNCLLEGNFTFDDSDHTSNGGGASGCTLMGCVLRDNQSLTGGGASGSTLVNCTVIYNRGNGGGANNCVMTNCILYFNNFPGGRNYSPDSTLVNCDAWPLATNGFNNIAADPQFADMIHISATSPGRGAGAAMAVSGVDIDGDAWLSPPSIGADEYSASSATGALTVAISQTFTNLVPGLVADFSATVTGHATSNRWDYGDGTVATNQLTSSHSWGAPGIYPVTFTAFNTDNVGGVSASVTIFVLVSPVHYVAQGNSTPLPPYMSWATAATNIQDAIDVAFAGGAIIVSNGLYQTGARILYGTQTNRVAVTKPLTLSSVNGAAATIIDGGGSARCLYLTNFVSVTGFTLQNGWAVNGAGVYCENSDVVNDCLIISNSSPADWSFGGGANGGVLNRCTLEGNLASYYGSGAANATLNTCTISHNRHTAYGGGAAVCTLSNCIVSGNSADWGGGLEYCTVYDTLIISNTAVESGGGAIFGQYYYNCLIISNSSPGGAGVDYGTIARNCIIYNNVGANWGGPVDLQYCCTIPDTGGYGNVTNAPLFVNPSAGDFHLQSTSPCINSGLNSAALVPTDFEGHPRIVGGTVDIGLYEFPSPTSVISYAYLQRYGLPLDGSQDYVDSDSDGLNNWQESLAGTSPINSMSLLTMLGTLNTNNAEGVTITWQSVNGANYSILRGIGQLAPTTFSIIQSNVIGQPVVTSFTDPDATNAGPYFYRVGIQ